MNIACKQVSWLRGMCLAALVGSLTSCASIRDTPRAALLSPSEIQLAGDIHLAHQGWPPAEWWKRYDDPQLDALIELGLRDSPTMQVAQARIQSARAGVERARVATRAAVAGIVDVNQQWTQNSGHIGPISLDTPIPGLEGAGSTHGGTIASAGVLGTYAFDPWGLKHSLLDAAVGVQNASLAETAATQLAVTTTIAQTYFNLQATLRTAALLEQMHAILDDMVRGMQASRQRGLVTRTDVAKVEAQRLAMGQLLSAARTQATDLREILRALVGAGANDFTDIHPLPLPAPAPQLPATLSYRLLSHRPDLVAMNWYVLASLDQVAAAKAAFYPSFDIKAFLGISRVNLGNVLQVTSKQFSVIPGLTLPLFDGGRLNANLHATRAASNVLIEQYNQAVLDAVQDVAMAATNMHGLQQQTRLEAEKLAELQRVANDANAHARRGLVSRIDARAEQIPLLQEQAQLVDTRSRALAADIALIKALGGGYDLPRDQLPPVPADVSR